MSNRTTTKKANRAYHTIGPLMLKLSRIDKGDLSAPPAKPKGPRHQPKRKQ